MGATGNDIEKLIDALDIELMPSRLSEAGQEINADIAFVASGGSRVTHSLWESV